MAGCDNDPDGCGLMETPGDASAQGLVRRPTIASGSKPPPAAWKKPSGASKMLSEAVHPSAARSTATVPFSAACPAWKGFVMEPKLFRNPPPSVATTPSAYCGCSTFSPRNLVQAAALPNDPHVPRVSKPSSEWRGETALANPPSAFPP